MEHEILTSRWTGKIYTCIYEKDVDDNTELVGVEESKSGDGNVLDKDRPVFREVPKIFENPPGK